MTAFDRKDSRRFGALMTANDSFDGMASRAWPGDYRIHTGIGEAFFSPGISDERENGRRFGACSHALAAGFLIQLSNSRAAPRQDNRHDSAMVRL